MSVGGTGVSLGAEGMALVTEHPHLPFTLYLNPKSPLLQLQLQLQGGAWKSGRRGSNFKFHRETGGFQRRSGRRAECKGKGGRGKGNQMVLERSVDM